MLRKLNCVSKTLCLFAMLPLLSCTKAEINQPIASESDFISAIDISSYPEISASNPTFYDVEGISSDLLNIFTRNGVNTIRLRLWVNPTTVHSGFNEVKQFSEILKNRGLKIWLSLHYSDTWADPGQQQQPIAWQNIPYSALKDSVYAYTKKVVTQIQPNYIQIGNEINSGFLYPHGNISNNNVQFKELLEQGILAVRENSDNTKVIIHFAGIEGATWFFDNIKLLDYDIIGLSYYPIWHGKSLENLKSTMTILTQTHNKDVVIAETAYPFTLDWNDWTNNIIGLETQLILPDFPATAKGQRDFVRNIRKLTKELPNNRGIGVCYWGAELIAWKGVQSTNGSPWENQAFFDFQNKVLPALEEFKDQ